MERLDKLLAGSGLMSRKEVKQLIGKGRVTVNGKVAASPDIKVEAATDVVCLDGKHISLSPFVYLMMNKPTGVVSATRDNLSETVVDLVPEALRRKDMFPAGRLDKDTVGFVLITNDGEFAHKILSPKNHLPKTYHARIDGAVSEELKKGFEIGIPLSGEERTSPAQIQILEEDANPLVEVVIYEGMYHQIKRMFERYGRKVLSLKRVKMGGLPLDETLKPGECRPLSAQELETMLLFDGKN